MKFPEEQYAKDLHVELQKAIGAKASISGAGCNWDCTVEWKNRSCRIHCFNQKGPEYLVIFNQGHRHATGRTTVQKEVVAAAKEWLSGQELAQLHDHFAFVDRQKRFFEKLAAEITELHPELRSTERCVHNQISDLNSLWIRSKERSCKLSFWGRNVHPDAVFHWDGCNLFSFPVDDSVRFALILKKWLCDDIAPSALQSEFPTLNLKKAALYYEQGRGVEGEFIESWDSIEEFYKEFKFPWVPAVQSLLKEMRKRGFDSRLRAGQSMTTLVLSRSRRHGLKPGQPNIPFHFRPDGMEIRPLGIGANTIHLPKIEMTREVEAQLNQLAEIEIS